MKTVFWGVRGSISSHSGQTTRYGGNTACIENILENGFRVIFDAGSGIRALGQSLQEPPTQPSRKSCTLIISHGHWDHVVGLPFFAPLYDPEWEITIYGPAIMCGTRLEELITNLFNPASFPVSWKSLQRPPRIVPLRANESLNLGCGVLRTHPANHGSGDSGALCYTLEADNTRLFYSGDHELGLSPSPEDPVLHAMRGANIAIVDAQYCIEHYLAKVGWGHSAMEQWPPLAQEYVVDRMVLTHFDPSYDDAMLDEMAEKLERDFPGSVHNVLLAHQGLSLAASSIQLTEQFTFSLPENCPNCAFSRELFESTDISMIFDNLLTEARRQANADAGTIYLFEDDRLHFSYAQNDTLFTRSEAARQQYLTASLPMDNTSIAGFAASNNVTVNIPDVYNLPEDVSYSFNPSFDMATGYRTQSVCVVPLNSIEGELVGVIQLINCLHEDEVVPFQESQLRHLQILGTMGAQAIERANMVRDMILRMLRTSALRDPTETAGHVMRVGAIVAEIYHRWAENRGMPASEVLTNKSHMRMAAMLHDVGKVGIADSILKKPGRLDSIERCEMERHCALGASLFSNATWELDLLARDIALHHHQKWDGTGYTGDPATPVLHGENIPLGARLTSIADVFDALVSRRCYKQAWSMDEAFALIKKEAGAHFDPEAVQAFLEIKETIVAINQKYQG